MGRTFLVYEEEDAVAVRSFTARLATRVPGAALDEFCPAFAFSAAPAWVVREARDRVSNSERVVYFVGASSAASGWSTWAANAARDAGKPMVCVRVHDSALTDVPPAVVAERRIPVLGADVAALVAVFEGREPPATAEARPGPLLSRLGQRR